MRQILTLAAVFTTLAMLAAPLDAYGKRGRSSDGSHASSGSHRTSSGSHSSSHSTTPRASTSTHSSTRSTTPRASTRTHPSVRSTTPRAASHSRTNSRPATQSAKPGTGSHKSTYAAGVQRDKHGRIERSANAKASVQRTNPCPSTGKASGACPGYVVDHVKPLKRGGADSPSNMQWQTKQAAREKDKTE